MAIEITKIENNTNGVYKVTYGDIWEFNITYDNIKDMSCNFSDVEYELLKQERNNKINKINKNMGREYKIYTGIVYENEKIETNKIIRGIWE